jgi:cytochrome c peroxidase
MKHFYLKLVFFAAASFILISGTIDLDNLFDYSDQLPPSHINTLFFDRVPASNPMNDKVATLGRVLFYDKHLSSNDKVACASCHHQENAFGLLENQGTGVNGLTKRRPMRLLNLRYKEYREGFFWDERADSLEQLATMPIQDHIEMGYSGTQGDQSFIDLIVKLQGLNYYKDLFNFAYGDKTITKRKIELAISNFLRSIQSYDSKYDTLIATGNTANWTADELAGRDLFTKNAKLDAGGARIGGGTGCEGCHDLPNGEFVIEKTNNGVITEIDGTQVLNITKSPSLRDIFDPNGKLNGPLFHNGQATTFKKIFDNYNNIKQNPKLGIFDVVMGIPANINETEQRQLEAFMKTLTGRDIYTNAKWSDPFDANGNISVIGNGISFTNAPAASDKITVFPNPTADVVKFGGLSDDDHIVSVHTIDGRQILSTILDHNRQLDLGRFGSGVFVLKVKNKNKVTVATKRVVVR